MSCCIGWWGDLCGIYFFAKKQRFPSSKKSFIASKRLLQDFRREHPHLKTIVVEDGLASNYPHLKLLDDLKLEYVIGVKTGDHKFLFEWIHLYELILEPETHPPPNWFGMEIEVKR